MKSLSEYTKPLRRIFGLLTGSSTKGMMGHF